LKLGINNFTSNLQGVSPKKVMDDWVDLGVEAERLGFWSLWVTEHHFGSDPKFRPFGVPLDQFPVTDYDMSVDPLTMLTFLAAKTSKLRLGTAVVILHWDHPIRVAERAATLDLFSGGRLELGVGRGAGFREMEVFQVERDPEKNNRKFKEAVDIIRKSWTGEEFHHQGEFWQFSPLILAPQPERKDAPIYVGSASMESAVWAAEQGLPYATITWPLTQIDLYRQKRKLYEETAKKAGKDVSKFDIPHILFMHCAETDKQAADEAYHHLTQFQYITESHYEQIGRAGRKWLGQDQESLKNVDALARFPVEHHIVGSPATCLERIRWFQRELNVTYIIGNVGFGRMPREMTHRSLRLIGEKVLPKV
jgi:alkanesulfonate monooxygenase SsuD/methylene tetrahydromethanopterin reductase-like flavin-dependent oxidoreductase (luciferase family)